MIVTVSLLLPTATSDQKVVNETKGLPLFFSKFKLEFLTDGKMCSSRSLRTFFDVVLSHSSEKNMHTFLRRTLVTFIVLYNKWSKPISNKPLIVKAVSKFLDFFRSKFFSKLVRSPRIALLSVIFFMIAFVDVLL